MSNPRHIPLAEARPGDMVFMKPLKFIAMEGEFNFRAVGDGDDYVYGVDEIDHIERAPKILKVGDRVMWKGRARVAWEIVFLDGLQAVLKVDGHGGGFTGLNLADFTDLEPAE